MSIVTPPHHQFANTTNEACDAFLYTRDEVLKYVKSLLQPVYNSGSLTDTQCAFVAKQTLLFLMSSANLGVRRYSTEFVA
ncbi:hypothetical protein LSM04_008574 [Trypanosoma melophagium]|uniref:uncharacterized protein n=1 Tax=Trypanosoma melophagium TaxID=715481 RepID=UPI00351A3B3B|nr:hypothetical protein LSM04_008574 [Trypanosoma melophagium]